MWQNAIIRCGDQVIASVSKCNDRRITAFRNDGNPDRFKNILQLSCNDFHICKKIIIHSNKNKFRLLCAWSFLTSKPVQPETTAITELRKALNWTSSLFIRLLYYHCVIFFMKYSRCQLSYANIKYLWVAFNQIVQF